VPENLFAYIVCGAEKSTDRIIFFATRRETPNGLFTLWGAASSMQEVQHSNLRRASSKLARRFARENGAT
jgi:hypothetical protein